MSVLLFDIDGTLVSTGGAGGEALHDAFFQDFEIDGSHEVPLSGRTDRGIGRNLFEMHGLKDSDANWQRLREGYLRRLPQYLPRFPGRVLPGVQPLLDRLASRSDTALGLLTGNTMEGARIKLDYFDLFRYFRFGGFGDEHHDRDGVAAAALRAARQHCNGHTEPVWVLGDTPLDITCARFIGAKVLAVATGIHPRHELATLKPDVLLDDLSDTEQVLTLLG
jgi:phosphoglycolate phosphatase-like HAD superfamily hydrolase